MQCLSRPPVVLSFVRSSPFSSVSKLNSLISSWPPQESHFCSNSRAVRAGVTKCSPYICLLCFKKKKKYTPTLFALNTYNLELSHRNTCDIHCDDDDTVTSLQAAIITPFKCVKHAARLCSTIFWCDQTEAQAGAEVKQIVYIFTSSET